MISLLARLLALKLVRDRWKARSKGSPPIVEHNAHTTTRPNGIPAQRAGGPGPDTPLELGRAAWKRTAKATLSEIKNDRVAFTGAAMAYYLFLAIFPALIALVGILGLAKIDARGLIESLQSSLPGGAGTALTSAIEKAKDPSDAASLTAAVVGIGVALWSGSSGMAALQTGLNIAYDVKRDRKFLAKRAVALVLLIATLILGGVPSPIFTFGESDVFVAVGWIMTAAAVMVLFSLFYYLGPNREAPTWHWVSAGGIFGALLWIAGSLLFGWYVSTFNSYGKTYGPLAGVIVLILWLYLSSIAVLVGGELNAELERQGHLRTERGSTRGDPRNVRTR